MRKNEYTGCWYCDNILDYPGQIGLLHLGYPRCFVLLRLCSFSIEQERKEEELYG